MSKRSTVTVNTYIPELETVVRMIRAVRYGQFILPPRRSVSEENVLFNRLGQWELVDGGRKVLCAEAGAYGTAG